MKQTTIFDYIEDDPKGIIIQKLKKYGIDDVYKEEFQPGSYTFLQIYETLSKNYVFTDYLKALADELVRYIQRSTDCYQDFQCNKENSTFTIREDCIVIYNSIEKSVGPIYCAEMLKREVLYGAEDKLEY